MMKTSILLLLTAEVALAQFGFDTNIVEDGAAFVEDPQDFAEGKINEIEEAGTAFVDDPQEFAEDFAEEKINDFVEDGTTVVEIGSDLVQEGEFDFDKAADLVTDNSMAAALAEELAR